jgi:hypothetical protein
MIFAVHCPTHASRVLLDEVNVIAVVNRPGHRPLVRWRCSCGTTGTWDPGREE